MSLADGVAWEKEYGVAKTTETEKMMSAYATDAKCKCGNSYDMHRAEDHACPEYGGGFMRQFKFELQEPHVLAAIAPVGFDSSKYACTACGATHGEPCPNSGQQCNFAPKKVKKVKTPPPFVAELSAALSLQTAGNHEQRFVKTPTNDEPIPLDALVPPAPAALPTTAAERKAIPIYSGFVKYFPLAIAAVAELSRKGNDQHNPGKPLHWDRSKSGDEMDAQMRHIVDAAIMGDDAPDTDDVLHATKNAWRAMANLQKILERK